MAITIPVMQGPNIAASFPPQQFLAIHLRTLQEPLTPIIVSD